MRITMLTLTLAVCIPTLAEAGPGSCRCRADRDSAGRLCGGRSSEAKSGGHGLGCPLPTAGPVARRPYRDDARRSAPPAAGGTTEIVNPLGVRSPAGR